MPFQFVPTKDINTMRVMSKPMKQKVELIKKKSPYHYWYLDAVSTERFEQFARAIITMKGRTNKI